MLSVKKMSMKKLQAVRIPLLMRNVAYRHWFIGDTVGLLGGSVAQMAVPLVIIGVSGSSALAGTIFSIATLVDVLMMVPAGVITDVLDRRLLVSAMALCQLLIYGVVIESLITGVGILWTLVIAIPVIEVFDTIGSVSLDAMLKTIVDAKDFPSAVSLQQGRSAAISMGGAPLGGWMYAVNRVWPFLGAVFGQTVTLLTVVGLRHIDFHPHRMHRGSASNGGWIQWLRFAWQGFRVLFTIPALGPMTITAMVVNLGFTGVMQTLIYSWTLTKVSPVAIGMIATGSTAGVLLGSVVSGPLVRRLPAGKLLIADVMLVVAGGGITAAFADQWMLVVAALVVMSFGSPSMNAVFGGYMAAFVDQEAQGRVNATSRLLSMSLMTLAPLLAGFGLEIMPVSTLLWAFTGIMLVAAIFAAMSAPVRALPPSSEWQVQEEAAGVPADQSASSSEPSSVSAQ